MYMENGNIILETGHLRYVIASDGKNREFTHKATGRNVLSIKGAGSDVLSPDQYFSKIILAEKSEVLPVEVKYEAPYLKVRYEKGYMASIRVAEHTGYITFSLGDVSGGNFRSIVFMNICVDIDYSRDSSFVASCMAMALNVRMEEYPGRNNILHCEAYTHIGLEGAKCAIIGSPEINLNGIMREVLDEIPDGAMPKAAYSGPYAPECSDAARTYTIGGVQTVKQVDEYVSDMRKYGISQVHMHQGGLYRQGDFHVLMTEGDDALKAMIRRYHELGVQVMLHSYTFFVDRWNRTTGNKYLSPVPHKDLGVFESFTLAMDIDDKAGSIPVFESTDHMSRAFGYSEQASPVVWIDDELIIIKDICKAENDNRSQKGKESVKDEKNTKKTAGGMQYGFTGCERGALGTAASAHRKGAKVKQLNSYFHFIAPEKNSELFFEIARNTSDFYNEYDFDGFYLDAIDGVFVLDGNEFSWYHAVLFINEMFKSLKKPPIFNCCYGPQYPGQWYARTRMGAWDSAYRGYRDFTDAHVAFNEKYAERMYLVGELGWWNLYPPVGESLGWQNRIMYEEDVDYICSKMLATDVCQCWHGGFAKYRDIPKMAGFQDKIMLYTKLKEEGYFSKEVKDEVRKPCSEFEIVKMSGGEDGVANSGKSVGGAPSDGVYRFRHMQTSKYRIESFDEGRNIFAAYNKFEVQKPKIRIETLYSTDGYDSPDSMTLLELDENAPLKTGRTYDIGPYDINAKRGLCVWLYGDGSGVTVNIRLRSTKHIAGGYSEHFIKADFTGWRCFDFYEFQNCEMPHEDWPPKQMEYKVFTDVHSFYGVYSSRTDYSCIAHIDILTNRPGSHGLRMKPVRAVPHREIILKDPAVWIGNDPERAIIFRTSLRSNTFLEYSPADGSCIVYDMLGNVLDRPEITGNAPVLEAGANTAGIMASCDLPCRKRAAVTFITKGGML